MFRVKICGVTSLDDALTAVGAGADAIGLNFYAKSPRRVTPAFALRAAAAIADRALAIGVFVNEPPEQIRRIAAGARLSAVQLHGDEPLSAIAELRPLRVVLARRLSAAAIPAFAEELAALRPGELPDALLIDAAAPGHFGGSGQTADWRALAGHDDWRRGVPLILAGGLTRENVAAAIAEVRPQGVDVASGVESAPGVKDAERVGGFVAAAVAAFSRAEFSR